MSLKVQWTFCTASSSFIEQSDFSWFSFPLSFCSWLNSISFHWILRKFQFIEILDNCNDLICAHALFWTCAIRLNSSSRNQLFLTCHCRYEYHFLLFFYSEAEKLCTKCAEKFSQESLSIKILTVQMPLLVTSLEVKKKTHFSVVKHHRSTTKTFFSNLGSQSFSWKTQIVGNLRYPSSVRLSYWTIAVAVQTLSSYEYENWRTRSNNSVHRTSENIERISGLSNLWKITWRSDRRNLQVRHRFDWNEQISFVLSFRSLFIRLDSDPKCVEALLVQLSARLASGHVNDK